MKTSTPVRLFVLCLVFIMLMAACGGDDKKSDTPKSDTDTVVSSTGNEITAENADQVVNLLTIGRGLLEDVAVSPDGHWLAVITREGVWLHDLETGSERHFMSESIDLPVFSPDGSALAGIGDDEALHIWRLAGDDVQILGSIGGVDQMAFSPDGRLLVTHQNIGGVDLVQGWSVEIGELVVEVEGATSFAVSPDSQLLAVGLDDHSVGVIDLATGEILREMEGHTDVVTALAFSPDGSTILSGGDDETVRLWDSESGDSLSVFNNGEILTDAAISLDGQSFMTIGVRRNQVSKIWDIETGEEIQVFEGIAHYLPDGQRVVTETRAGDLGVWDIATGDLVQSFTGHSERASHLVVADGTVISASIGDGSVQQWDVATGEAIHIFENFFAANAEFTPTGQTLLSWWQGGLSPNRQLNEWDAQTGTRVRAFSAPEGLLGGGLGFGFSNDFSSDGRWLAFGDGLGVVWIWNAETGQLVHQLQSESLNRIEMVVFSPDGSKVAGVLRPFGAIWDVETGELLEEFGASPERQASSMLLDYIGSAQVMFRRGDRVEVWSPELEESVQLGFDRENDDFFEYATSGPIVSPDGQTALFKMAVIDVPSGETLYTLDIEETILPTGISYSFDSRYLLAASTPDGRLVVIETRTGEVIQRIDIDGLTDAAWSSVNHMIAAVNEDGVWLYDGVTGEQLWSLDLSQRYAPQVAFSPTGDYFMTTGHELLYYREGIVCVFGLPTE